MELIVPRVIGDLERLGIESIFFSKAVLGAKPTGTERQTLRHLVHQGKIIRLAYGIYYYPETDRKWRQKVKEPTVGQIARAIAQRDGLRIVPAGDYVLYLLGLTLDEPKDYEFITDGCARHINLSRGRRIVFKKATPDNLAFSNPRVMLINAALKAIGRSNVTKGHIWQVAEMLRREDEQEVRADMHLMQEWIKKIVEYAFRKK